MSGWRYLLYEVNGDGTDTLIRSDLPLSNPTLTRVLSGPHSISATLEIPTRALLREDGEPLIRRWKSMIVAEDPNEQVWLAGLVAGFSIDGPTMTLDISGFTGYAANQPYEGAKDFLEADPIAIIRYIWDWLQSHPGGSLGLRLDGSTETPIRLGHGTYATDENGEILPNLAIPHKQWDELYDLQWVGGPVHKVHVEESLWTWLINHGFDRGPDNELGQVVYPPTTWTEEFPWWEVELLNRGWVGGPVRRPDVPSELWEFLSTHGWAPRSGDAVEKLYPPSTEPDTSAYPDPVWDELYRLQWAGGIIRRSDVPDWVAARVLEIGWTQDPNDADVLRPPAENITATATGLPGWEVDLINKGWVGGPVRHSDLTQLQWDYLHDHRWRTRPDGPDDLLWQPDRIRLFLDEDDIVVEAEPYSLNWWSTGDLGAKIDELVSEFDYLEQHSWDIERTRVVRTVKFGYPTLGTRRHNLRFVLGENVFKMPSESLASEDVLTGVIVLGAGEGRARVRGSAYTSPTKSLRRVKTVTDKLIESNQDADRRAQQILAKHQAEYAGSGVTELVIRNSDAAPMGSYDVGDEILYAGDHDWGPVDVWVKIVKLTVNPEESDDMIASVVRA